MFSPSFLYVEENKVRVRNGKELIADIEERGYLDYANNEIIDRYIASSCYITSDAIEEYVYDVLERDLSTGDTLDTKDVQDVLEKEDVIVIGEEGGEPLLESMKKYLANPSSWIHLKKGDKYRISESTEITKEEYEEIMSSAEMKYHGQSLQSVGSRLTAGKITYSISYIVTKEAEKEMHLVDIGNQPTSDAFKDIVHVEGFDPSIFRDGTCSGHPPFVYTLRE